MKQRPLVEELTHDPLYSSQRDVPDCHDPDGRVSRESCVRGDFSSLRDDGQHDVLPHPRDGISIHVPCPNSTFSRTLLLCRDPMSHVSSASCGEPRA